MRVRGTNGQAARYPGVDKRWKHIEIDKKGPGSNRYQGFLLLWREWAIKSGHMAATILIVYGAGASFLPSGVV